MEAKQTYTDLDRFRVAAAFLVIAIHTSPLWTYTQTGDFLLTRVVARVAVPFFFLASGFFLLSGGTGETGRLTTFLKKTAILYAVSILLYLPLNYYNGYFETPTFLPQFLRDLVFDGTLYHLWYLPASMLGAALAWVLIKKLNCPAALAVTGVLYLIGLFGDSYFGLTQQVPWAKALYHGIFTVFDYTRNGLFFAPVFFVLGGWLSQKKDRPTLVRTLSGLIVSFALMLVEALLLHHYHLQRHDSMYLFLLPTMVFLFRLLTIRQGRGTPWLRPASLAIYILHPMMIVAVRLAAKVLHCQPLLVDNSLVRYLAVSVMTTAVALMVVLIWKRWKRSEII